MKFTERLQAQDSFERWYELRPERFVPNRVETWIVWLQTTPEGRRVVLQLAGEIINEVAER